MSSWVPRLSCRVILQQAPHRYTSLRSHPALTCKRFSIQKTPWTEKCKKNPRIQWCVKVWFAKFTSRRCYCFTVSNTRAVFSCWWCHESYSQAGTWEHQSIVWEAVGSGDNPTWEWTSWRCASVDEEREMWMVKVTSSDSLRAVKFKSRDLFFL